MRRRARRLRSVLTIALLPLAAPLAAQQVPDSLRAGRFDLGRMWTFENAPSAYFTRTYGFAADSAWFARARMAALRIPGCSAGLVSPHGLIVTNHHCVRGRLPAVQRPGETLLDSGFVAATLADERRIPGFYADQLLAALDVSDEVNAAVDRAPDDAGREAARREASASVRRRLGERYAGSGDSIWVQIVPLYSGGRTSAYVFRRLTDIRFVAAVELQMGFFGGDPDNFTYPRYALDFAVLRAWGRDGRPLATPDHFAWGGDGVRAGDAVFVIGNPGQTARLTTMAQLAYLRDVSVPAQLGFLRSRLEAMRSYRAAYPAEAESLDIRNRMFGLSNSEKSLGGRLEALHDATIMARRQDAEGRLVQAIAARPDLRPRYGQLFARVAALQAQKRRYEAPYRAFGQLVSASAGSGTLQRAYWAWRIRNGPADSVAVFRQRFERSAAWPRDLERRFLALQLADIAAAYGPRHPITLAALAGTSAEAAADRLLATSMLADPVASRSLADGTPPADDAAVVLAQAIVPPALEMERALAGLAVTEGALAADLGRARYAVYGDSVPPDGSSSPRIADGVVQGYAYNGTLAPAWTTFYGIYDRYRSNGPGTDWDLPHRWRTPPAGLDLGTPLNFVSTADTYGGNSGSPAVTSDLRLVGLNFDRNVNALVRDYIFLPERGRNVMVDARAIDAALTSAYGAGRVVRELRTGRLE